VDGGSVWREGDELAEPAGRTVGVADLVALHLGGNLAGVPRDPPLGELGGHDVV
jgi:hypothetical protein